MRIGEALLKMIRNTAAVCQKVNGHKVTVSGSPVRVEDVLAVEQKLQVAAATGTQVTVAGKNLLQCESLDTGTDGGTVLFQGQLTGDFYFSCSFRYDSIKTPAAAQFSLVVDGVTKYMARGSSPTHGIAISGTLTKITFLNWGYGEGTVEQLQLEAGSRRTDYAPYVQPQMAVAADGKVTGLCAVSPVMTLVTDTGAPLKCTYLPETARESVVTYQRLKQKMQNWCKVLKEERL